MSVEVPLTRGLIAVIDDADEKLVASYKWCAYGSNRGWYAIAGSGRILMHRLIMDAPAGMEVDHINWNGLDNRRMNLRIATNGQNRVNQPKRMAENPTSRFKGVSWDYRRQLWVARASFQGKSLYLGGFEVEEDAARAYDEKAYALWGDFAYLNFGGDLLSS